MLNNWILYKIICLSKKQFNDNCSNIFLQSHVTKCQQFKQLLKILKSDPNQAI